MRDVGPAESSADETLVLGGGVGGIHCVVGMLIFCCIAGGVIFCVGLLTAPGVWTLLFAWLLRVRGRPARRAGL